MANASLTTFSKMLEQRILAKVNQYKPDDPRIAEALQRIGMLIQAEARLNIARQRIVDTGNLMNSIRYRLYREDDKIGVQIGSFGVVYAAIHEFGMGALGTTPEARRLSFTVRMRRAMFASLALRGRMAKPGTGIDKDIVQGTAFRARPYLRPALEAHRERISQILREASKK